MGVALREPSEREGCTPRAVNSEGEKSEPYSLRLLDLLDILLFAFRFSLFAL